MNSVGKDCFEEFEFIYSCKVVFKIFVKTSAVIVNFE